MAVEGNSSIRPAHAKMSGGILRCCFRGTTKDDATPVDWKANYEELRIKVEQEQLAREQAEASTQEAPKVATNAKSEPDSALQRQHEVPSLTSKTTSGSVAAKAEARALRSSAAPTNDCVTSLEEIRVTDDTASDVTSGVAQAVCDKGGTENPELAPIAAAASTSQEMDVEAAEPNQDAHEEALVEENEVLDDRIADLKDQGNQLVGSFE